MDYSKATKRQLYQIATDSELKMSIRVAAVQELQRRRGVSNDSWHWSWAINFHNHAYNELRGKLFRNVEGWRVAGFV